MKSLINKNTRRATERAQTPQGMQEGGAAARAPPKETRESRAAAQDRQGKADRDEAPRPIARRGGNGVPRNGDGGQALLRVKE